MVNSGEISSRTTSGTFFSKKPSSFAVTNPINRATIIPPWKPTRSTPMPKICKVVTSTVPWAAAYALARLSLNIMQPMTIPRMGLPPNRLQALYATASGRKPKIAPDEILISLLIPNSVSLAFTNSRFPSTPESPVSRAAARIPGIISTNTSDNALIIRCKGFIFLLATVFRSLRLIFFI